jgi:hypothetical protein
MKMIRLILSALAALTCTTFASAQGTYTQIDYPGAIDTYMGNINTAGDLDGNWLDENNDYHGFYLSNGTFTPINYPGAQNTVVGGLNDKGQIVGYAFPNTQPRSYFGFLYDVQTQTFTTVKDQAVSTTLPGTITDSGLIAGTVYTNSGATEIFVLKNSAYNLIAGPPALQGGYFGEAGISNSNAILVTGQSQSGQWLNYWYSNGTYTPISLPQENQLQLDGANPQGNAYVGDYQPAYNVIAGFLYQNGVFTSLQYPGSEDTNAESLSSTGEVVGLFTGADGKVHGFTWTPPADEKKK